VTQWALDAGCRGRFIYLRHWPPTIKGSLRTSCDSGVLEWESHPSSLQKLLKVTRNQLEMLSSRHVG
jgi:hypothetical protein